MYKKHFQQHGDLFGIGKGESTMKEDQQKNISNLPLMSIGELEGADKNNDQNQPSPQQIPGERNSQQQQQPPLFDHPVYSPQEESNSQKRNADFGQEALGELVSLNGSAGGKSKAGLKDLSHLGELVADGDKPGRGRWSTLAGKLSYALKQGWKDLNNNRCFCSCAVFSLMFSCTIILIALSILSKVPIIFYQLSAVSNGEIDIKVTPQNNHLFNGSRINSVLKEAGLTQPVFRLMRDVYLSDNLALLSATAYVPRRNLIRCNGAFVNISNERQSGILVDAQLNALEPDQVYVPESLAEALSLKDGSWVFVRVEFSTTAHKMKELYDEVTGDLFLTVNTFAITKMRIKTYQGELISMFGNLATSSTPLVLLDLEDSLSVLASGFRFNRYAPAPQNLTMNFSQFSLADFANQMIFQLPDRLEYYLESSTDELVKKIIPFSSRLLEKLGTTDLEVELPLAADLVDRKFAVALIVLIIEMVVLGIFVMAAWTINIIVSMMMTGKIHDIAVLRKVGISRPLLTLHLVVFSLLLSAMGLLLALGLVSAAIYLINTQLLPLFDLRTKLTPSATAISLCVLAGIGIPLFSIYAPLLEYLYQSTSGSLSATNSKTEAFQVQIKKKSNGFPLSYFLIAALSAGLGIIIHIYLPSSMVSLDLSTFFLIFFLLMGCLLFGMQALIINFSYLIEKLFLLPVRMLLRCRTFKAVPKLIHKNLISHRLRNRQAVFVFSLCVSMISFLAVSVDMQISGTITRFRVLSGGSFNLYNGISASNWKKLIKDNRIGSVMSWGSRSFELKSLKSFLGFSTYTGTNRGGIISFNPKVYSLSPNYESFIVEPSLIAKTSKDFKLGALTTSEYLYTRFTSCGAMVSDNVRANFNLQCGKTHDSLLLRFEFDDRAPQLFDLSCSQSFSRYPGFNFKEKRKTDLSSDMVISHDSYISLLDDEQIPFEQVMNYSRIYLSVKDPNIEKQLLQTIRKEAISLKFAVHYDKDKVSSLQSTVQTVDLVLLSFSVLLVYFGGMSVLSVSYCNTVEQSAEIASIRCLGMSASKVYSVMMLETLLVITVGIFIGLISGLFIGATLISQMSLFTNTKAGFSFPVLIFATIYLGSVAAGAGISWFISRLKLNKSIVKLMRQE